MANKFTVFEKFGNACEQLNETDRQAFMGAIMAYGMFGTEPNLQYPLNAMFELVREDIDNSVNASKKVNKGGRPPKDTKPQENEVFENEKQGVSEDKNRGFSNSKTGGFENEKGGVSENKNRGFLNSEKGGFENSITPPYKTSQANTSQYKPIQAKKREKALTKFVPPSSDEVKTYANEWISENPKRKGVFSMQDAEQFVAFYASNGWKVGKNPMKDWKASVRTWHLRNEKDRGSKGVFDNDIAAEFAAYD